MLLEQEKHAQEKRLEESQKPASVSILNTTKDTTMVQRAEPEEDENLFAEDSPKLPVVQPQSLLFAGGLALGDEESDEQPKQTEPQPAAPKEDSEDLELF
jgi:hypothetical protein